MNQQAPLQFSTEIEAPVPKVWDCLTKPSLMIRWMGEPEMKLHVETDWRVESAITVKGYHHVWFENKGIVLAFEPNKLLRYTHLSSVSRLPEKSENFTTIEFILEPKDNQTRLTVVVSNFPMESIYKHFEFYWRNTLSVVKEVAESSGEQKIAASRG